MRVFGQNSHYSSRGDSYAVADDDNDRSCLLLGKRRYNIKLWKIFTDCFNCLPVAAIVDEKILCMHGSNFRTTTYMTYFSQRSLWAGLASYRVVTKFLEFHSISLSLMDSNSAWKIPLVVIIRGSVSRAQLHGPD